MHAKEMLETVSNPYFMYFCEKLTNMKNLISRIAITLLVSLSLCTYGYAKNENSASPLTDLLESYEGKDGVEYMNLKGLMLSFARPALKDTPMKNMADKIDNLSIFAMSGTSSDTGKQFSKELSGILSGYEKVMETKEGKKESIIYLKKKDDAVISEMVVYASDGNTALIVMKGDIPVAALQEMAEAAKK